MATGAEGGTLGTGVAVHLPIDFNGLSEWTEKKTEKSFSTLQAKEIHHTANNTGCGSMHISCMELDRHRIAVMND